MVKTLKETLYQPDPTWLQFRRRLNKLEPFCKIPGHTSEEIREILAALETVYREALPQLNLRQWSSSIYTWLTQLALDPTSSGRVTMDNLMTLVTAALEWSYETKATDVKAEMLEKAASLLVLHRDTLKLIDGAGPSVEAPQVVPAEQGNESKTEPETEPERETVPLNQTETVITAGEQVQTAKTPKCTFPGVVSIDLKRFQDSGVALVECPNCARTRSLKPHKGVLRFPSHDKRKTRTPNIEHRWAMSETIWGVVG